MEQLTKHKIRILVSTYKKLFPEEYKDVCAIVREKRQLQLTETAAMKKGDHVQERLLLEYPATLHDQIYNSLKPEEFVQFNEKKGQRWFAREFPEFRVPAKL